VRGEGWRCSKIRRIIFRRRDDNLYNTDNRRPILSESPALSSRIFDRPVVVDLQRSPSPRAIAIRRTLVTDTPIMFIAKFIGRN